MPKLALPDRQNAKPLENNGLRTYFRGE